MFHACGVLNKPVRWDADEDDVVLEAIVGQEHADELDYRRSFHPTAPGRYALGHATTFGTGVAFYYRPMRSWIKRTLRLGPKVRVIMIPLEKGDWPESA